MSDIAENRSYSPKDITSIDVTEMTQGLVSKLCGRGKNRKRKAATSDRKENKINAKKTTDICS
jgi:hypothetical protein